MKEKILAAWKIPFPYVGSLVSIARYNLNMYDKEVMFKATVNNNMSDVRKWLNRPQLYLNGYLSDLQNLMG